VAITKKFALQWGTTKGLLHVLPSPENEDQLVPLTQEKVRQYYAAVAEETMKHKKTTCDGLCATAFALAKNILEKKSDNLITVEICSLRNWSHTLIRVSQTSNSGTRSFFYDPWHQHSGPKTFSEEQLGIEMEKLISQAKGMIQPTITLHDPNENKQVANNSRDYSYQIACSTGQFTNPSQTVNDPTKKTSSMCMVC
jgi:hypothetical protein